MNTLWLIAALVISLALILVSIIVFRLNAALALIIGSMIMGALTGLPMIDTITGINEGFGSMMKGIGLPIGFGIILGQILSDSGGAKAIADRIVTFFPSSKALYAIAVAAFILAIPVFFDVTFVILIPIGLALLKELDRPIIHMVGAITIGAAAAHTLVPPTPAPLAAGEIFGFDIGILVGVGAVFGLVITFVTTWAWIRILDRGLITWLPDTDIAPTGTAIKEHEDQVGVRRPGFWISLLPIVTPVVLILGNTVSGMVMSDPPGIFAVLGDKTVALLAGALVAYVIGVACMGWEATEASATASLSSLGVVLLITGGGGAFSKIISLSGIADAIAKLATGFANSVWVVIIISYLVGLAIKQATGSGTVSALTSMGIMSAVAPMVDLPPVFIALACLSGTLFGATVNDSGFWIVTNLSGLTVKGGIKSYTFAEMVMSVICLVTLLVAVAGYTIIT